jgi:hypothetical protein
MRLSYGTGWMNKTYNGNGDWKNRTKGKKSNGNTDWTNKTKDKGSTKQTWRNCYKV